MSVKKISMGGYIPLFLSLLHVTGFFRATFNIDGRQKNSWLDRYLTEDVLHYFYIKVISKNRIFLVQIHFTPFLPTRMTPSERFVR